MRRLQGPREALGRLPISVRLGSAFACVFLLVLTVLTALAYWGLGATLRPELDRTLVDAVEQAERHGPAVREIGERELGGVESAEVETQLLDGAGVVLAASDDDLRTTALVTPVQVRAAFDEGALFADAHDGDEPQRVLAKPLLGTPGQVLVLAVELDPVVESQQALLRRAGPLSAVAGLLAGLTGWLVARRGLEPVTELAAQAESLGAQDLSRRLELPRTEDEVVQLGRTLNAMLSRIETARQRERRFTADASHELRTPLAILRAEVELARGHAADGGQLARSLDSALEECDRLRDLVDDLLAVARAEAGRLDLNRLVDVAEIADRLLPRFAVLARQRGVSLARRGDAAVRADPRALARALSNLLDNAVRHAAQDGHVELAITADDADVVVTVTDDGAGVAPEDREHLTERFAQLDPVRDGVGGAGLGLAMVASVAAAHAGSLSLSTPGTGHGLAVTLRLPASAGDGR